MAIRLNEFVAMLPEADQEAIRTRTEELMTEEAMLRRLREARQRSEGDAAKMLHLRQTAVSELERRDDMSLSTLRGFVEAMGGTLEIVARFPDQTVRITQFEGLDSERSPQE